jgi:hypothetical protein
MTGVDDAQSAECLPEDQQPERGLHHACEEFGAVVAELLHLDDREGAHPQRHSVDTPPTARRTNQCDGCSVAGSVGTDPWLN